MKNLIIFLSVLLTSFQNKDFDLNGKYKVQFNQHEKEYTIILKDTLFSKIMPNGGEIHGIVKYEKNNVYLYEYKSYYKLVGDRIVTAQSNEIEKDETISLSKSKNDTINFCLHMRRNNGPMNWLDICVKSGKFIKIK